MHRKLPSDFDRKHIISQIFAKNTMPFAQDEDIAFLLDTAEHTHKRKGSFIYMENDEPDSFYLILSGKVELSKHSHEKIAEMLRLSRERVTKMLNAMKSENRIAIDDTSIIVFDSRIIQHSRNYNFSHIRLYGSKD